MSHTPSTAVADAAPAALAGQLPFLDIWLQCGFGACRWAQEAANLWGRAAEAWSDACQEAAQAGGMAPFAESAGRLLAAAPEFWGHAAALRLHAGGLERPLLNDA